MKIKTIPAFVLLVCAAFVSGCTSTPSQIGSPSNEAITKRAAPITVTITNFITITNFVTATNLVMQTLASNSTKQAANTPSINPNLSAEDIAYFKQQGYSDQQIANASYVDTNSIQTTDMSPTPPDLKGALIYMKSFLGMANQTVPGDVISMSPQALKFRFMGKDYDYSGNYAVVLNTPRKHENPYFGFGSPDTANIVLLDDVCGQQVPLQNATIWEKEGNFIDAVSYAKEWIYSGTYSIQN